MAASAERTRRYRERKATGRRVIKIEVDEIAIEGLLIDLGHLSPLASDDPAAVANAFDRLIERMIAVHRERVTRHRTP